MRLLDRVVMYNYLKAYMIVLISLLSLYIVVDLFTNLDDFAQIEAGFWAILRQIVTYYSYKTAQIFDRLCEAIVLLAAMFTVAWMQRSNEILPLLSAGVSTRRAIRPVFMGAALMLSLGIANQEFVIPQCADFLLRDKDDLAGEKAITVQGEYDATGVHVEGLIALRKGYRIYPFYVTVPDHLASGMIHLSAAEANYIPTRPGEKYSGGWLLTDTVPAEIDGGGIAGILEQIDTGRYFLHTTDASFDSVSRNRQWFMFASTLYLRDLLARTDSRRSSAIAVLFHSRLTRPILGFLLVVLGLSVILRDQNRHVFISAGLCLIMCVIFFAAIFMSKNLGENDVISPALAAWLPVMIFGPLAFTLFDAIHT